MKFRLTPINISIACLLTWYIAEWGQERQTVSFGWLILLIVVCIAVDVLFRVAIKENQKLWFMQIGFILMVSILSVLIKLYI